MQEMTTEASARRAAVAAAGSAAVVDYMLNLAAARLVVAHALLALVLLLTLLMILLLLSCTLSPPCHALYLVPLCIAAVAKLPWLPTLPVYDLRFVASAFGTSWTMTSASPHLLRALRRMTMTPRSTSAALP